MLAESFRFQYVTFGTTVLRIVRGMLEGQSSSTKVQNCFHQKLINMEVDRLKEEGKEEEAKDFMETTSAFVDDSLSLEGMLKDRDITRG